MVRSVDRSAGSVHISWLLRKQDLPASLDLQALGGSEVLVASWANACVPLSAMRNPVEVLSLVSLSASRCAERPRSVAAMIFHVRVFQ